MLVSHDDQPGGDECALHLRGGVAVVGFLDPAAEEPMDLFVHSSVDHHLGVGVDDLKRRAGLNTRIGRGPAHGKILRAG